jgi:hypothetical protein
MAKAGKRGFRQTLASDCKSLPSNNPMSHNFIFVFRNFIFVFRIFPSVIRRLICVARNVACVDRKSIRVVSNMGWDARKCAPVVGNFNCVAPK